MKGGKIMIKKVIILRMCTWGIGMILILISRFVFLNDNDMIWYITKHYNEIVVILSLIPITQVMLIVDMIRNKENIILHFLTMLFVLILFLIYICVWVACTGGI